MQEYTGIIIISMLLAILVIVFWSIIETINNFDARKQEYKNYMEGIHKLKRTNIKDVGQYYRDYKGTYGEFEVYKILHRKLEGRHLFYHNVYIPKNMEDNLDQRTEVDFIMVHEKGLFILEIKNLYGDIYGSIEDRDWIQKVDSYNNKKIYNPIMQNDNHIKYIVNNLEEADIEIPNEKIYSIIVFGNDSNIDLIKIYEEDNLKIINIDELESCLNFIIENNDIMFETEEMSDIALVLEKYQDVDDTIREKHISSIKTLIDNK